MNVNDIKAMRMHGEGLDNDGQYWTEQDKKSLLDYFEAGVGITEAALLLKRSEPAILQMLLKENCFKSEVKTRKRTNRSNRCICDKCEEYEFCVYSPKNRDQASAANTCPKEANVNHV